MPASAISENARRFLLTVACAAAIAAPFGMAGAAPGKNNGLGSRIDALEAELESLRTEVRLFHRKSAAVIEINSGGSSSNAFTSVEFSLVFCTDEEYTLNQALDCPAGSPDIVVNLENGDSGKLYSFTADNEPDFAAIAALLSNGDADWVISRRSTGSGGGSSSSREDIYFRDFLPPDGIDLENYSIGRITIAADTVIISGTNPTEYILRGNVFYELAE